MFVVESTKQSEQGERPRETEVCKEFIYQCMLESDAA